MRKKYYKAENRRKFYSEMLAKTNGTCMICGKPERLVIDHSHETGLMRGLLCYAHNTAIGMFKDSPDLLRKAAEYLEANGEIELPEKPAIPINEAVLQILDEDFDSDRARAKKISSIFPISLYAAQSRVSRARRLRQKRRITDSSCAS